MFCRLEKSSGLADIDQSHGDTAGALRYGFGQSLIPFFEPRHSSRPKKSTSTYGLEPGHDKAAINCRIIGGTDMICKIPVSKPSDTYAFYDRDPFEF